MKTKIVALFCSCYILLTAVDMFVPRSESNIYDNCIRLHILAQDNSQEAQEVKLLVRDEILKEYGDLFSENGNYADACETVQQKIPQIQATANKVLSENGMDYKATIEWGYEEYPTRVYENFSLPAGEYRSLRVVLGEGDGNNWWCVLFPPLCTGAASGDDLSSADINDNDSQVFTNKKYIFRFKILELFR